MLSGRVNAGYRIRDGKWLEIGRMSPQKPQVGLYIHFFNCIGPYLVWELS